ncbi:hypothetical protein ARHIZOSPH14_34000 [Agromyces rhizosphaerae]|uniref:Uncharacterized protein n=1 Tax=Agromyces rhizosphaerae TaxID=88374 RepID=A0A9W6CVD5_9MICO|nr:hypothetical protein [Agromyces rhizosphaerae]GLI29158.1 hypothetical protein ARHIZOSPH14_34000 [Agromyces rhizosphaerae]
MSDAPTEYAGPEDVSTEDVGPGASADVVDEASDLADRLRDIDDLPLEQRAAAFEQLHGELRARLEGADPETAD